MITFLIRNLSSTRLLGALLITLFFTFYPLTVTSPSYLGSRELIEINQTILTSYNVNVTNLYWEELIDDIKYLSSLSDRVTGSYDFHNLTMFLCDKLRGVSGVELVLQNYTVAVPVAGDSYIEVDGNRVKVYPLSPNGGVPVNAFVEGRAIVIRSLDEVDGKILRDSVIFIDMGVDWRWINLLDPSIGVKAVVFYRSESISRSKALDKFFDTPINLPLGFIDIGYNELLDMINGSTVKLRLSSKWVARDAHNIIAYVKGDNSEFTVLLVSHYDSWSPALGLAPGASDTIAPLYLIYLAKYLSTHKPPYDTVIALFSGFYQGLAGHRFFVEQFIHQRKPVLKDLSIDPKKTFIVGLDLTYGSRHVTPVSIGYFYSAQSIGITAGPLDYYAAFIRSVFGEQEFNIIRDPAFKKNVEYSTSSTTWWQLIPGPYWLDTEPFWSSGLAAFTLKTAFSENRFRATPVDSIDRLFEDIDNVKTQFSLVDKILTSIYVKSRDSIRSAISIGSSPVAPTRTPRTARNEMFTKLIGRVYLWNPVRDTKEEIGKHGFSHALIIVKAGSRVRTTSTWNVRIAAFTDSDGFFEITGLHHTVASALEIRALLLDSDSDVYALNIGGRLSTGSSIGIGESEVGSREAPWEVYVYPYNGSITLNILLNPADMMTPIEGASIGVNIVESSTHASTQFYRVYIDETGYTAIYVDEYKGYDVIIGSNTVLYVFTNVKPGENLSTLKGLEDTIKICEERYVLLRKYGITSPLIESYLTLSKNLLDYSRSNLTNHEYSLYLSNLYAGLSTAHQLYGSVKSTYLDVTNTGILYSVLLVLSGFVFGLLFRKHGDKPVKVFLKTLLVLTALGVLFGNLHPAFKLTTNAIMAVIGFVAFILTIPIILVLIGDFNEALAIIRRAAKGVHEVVVSKVATSYVALSYGVEHMRKRKLRSALTLSTLIVIVVSLVLFTSLTSYVEPKPFAVRSTPTRPEGYLIQLEGIDRNFPLGRLFLDLTKSVARGETYGRFWYTGNLYIIPEKNLGAWSDLEGILILDPLEINELNLSRMVVEGGAFTGVSCREIMIPKTIIENLRIKYNVTLRVNDTVFIVGVPFKLVGVFDSDILASFRELDRDASINPVKGFPRSRAYSVAILPVCIVEDDPWLGKGLSPFLAQVSTYVDGSTAVSDAPELIRVFPVVDFYVYSINSGVHKFSKLVAIRGSGFYYIIPPLIIASISILSVLLGSLYERRREVYIYAAVGLSPIQIGLMFLSETLAYGLISVVIGYATGLATTSILNALFHEAFKPNYSSGYVTLSLGFTMIAVLMATIYPIYKAGRMALPSLKRRWEYPSKPVGDEWIIPLPFKFTSFKDLSGAYSYLVERLSGFVNIDVGNFVVERVDAEKKIDDKGVHYVLKGEVRLKPWQSGVKQYFEIRAGMVKVDEWDLSLYIKRLSGNPTIWFKSNKYFIDDLRKQLLLWRTLSLDDRAIYYQKSIFE